MKTSSRWGFRSIGAKILMGLVLSVMIGSMDIAPALAREGNDRGGKHDNGRYENRGRGHDRGHYVQGRRGYRSYGYREPVYVSPPVIYEPPRPPGVGIFFPPVFIRP